MGAIIVAIITAITSIIVALIHAVSSQKVARISREQELKKTPTSTQKIEQIAPKFDIEPIPSPIPYIKISRGRSYRVWWLVVIFITVESIIVRIFSDAPAFFLYNQMLIFLATCILSLIRPIFWGYAAFFVTLLQGINYINSTVGLPYPIIIDRENIPILALIFIGNAGICALISFLRLRRIEKYSRLKQIEQ